MSQQGGPIGNAAALAEKERDDGPDHQAQRESVVTAVRDDDEPVWGYVLGVLLLASPIYRLRSRSEWNMPGRSRIAAVVRMGCGGMVLAGHHIRTRWIDKVHTDSAEHHQQATTHGHSDTNTNGTTPVHGASNGKEEKIGALRKARRKIRSFVERSTSNGVWLGHATFSLGLTAWLTTAVLEERWNIQSLRRQRLPTRSSTITMGLLGVVVVLQGVSTCITLLNGPPERTLSYRSVYDDEGSDDEGSDDESANQ